MQRVINHSRQMGFTLVELLLSMVFGLIVISGITAVYVAVLSSSSETLRAAKLNSQLMTMMTVIANDVRRAGYWHNEDRDLPSTNPFNVEDDSLLAIVKSIGDNSKIVEDTDEAGRCILYSYDRNENGDVDDIGADNEYFGVRLNDGVVEIRNQGSVTDGDNCSNGVWEAISDADLYQVTELSFNPVGSACVNASEPNDLDSPNDADADVDNDIEADCYQIDPVAGDVTVETREILITLAAQLNADANVVAQIQQSVRVRNDVVRIR
ncbi:hypothetical protein QWY77_02840 [Thalassotalea ponticola]|uniref:hypothetical protein n=1 Tax=Thalassotalea ponticola TaxID=1523392 RepID=UPI0025B38C38|nr:hypothetical protein [Thalassotalea ponticola]MDN3651700.1 hypothetical protein [Thalassotalea ponticola]